MGRMVIEKPGGARVVKFSVYLSGDLAEKWLAIVAEYGRTPPTNSSLAARLIADGIEVNGKKSRRRGKEG